MYTLRFLTPLLALALAACTTVSTQVVKLDPAREHAPTTQVEVLLAKPARAHVEIALLESLGGSEAEILNDAREKARALGADAIIRIETERRHHPAVAVYDPWLDPFFHGNFRRRPFPPVPHPWAPGPWVPYRIVGERYSYVLKSVAIRYEPAEPASR